MQTATLYTADYADQAESGKENRKSPSQRTLYGIDGLNFFLADIQAGVGPFIAIYLAGYHWNEQQVGIALTVGSIAGILTQTPAGWLVDNIHAKRAMFALGIAILAASALTIAFLPSFWPAMGALAVIGSVSCIFAPTICAISLGIVGYAWFDCRQGRNQAFNSAGNVAAAISMGLLGYFISDRSIFFFVAASALPVICMLFLINPGDIDYELARGAKTDHHITHSKATKLFHNHPLALFLICSVMFHFANAAMLPLLGQMLAKGQGRTSMMFMSACVVTPQIVITLIAGKSGRMAGIWGRKPLLLIAFGALPIRGVLYTLTHNTALLLAIQILDGIGAGLFGVVSVLVVADLTHGTGRFNLALGAIATAVGIGASLSQTIAGSIVHHFGYNSGFLFLATIATVAFAILLFFMPETNKNKTIVTH